MHSPTVYYDAPRASKSCIAVTVLQTVGSGNTPRTAAVDWLVKRPGFFAEEGFPRGPAWDPVLLGTNTLFDSLLFQEEPLSSSPDTSTFGRQDNEQFSHGSLRLLASLYSVLVLLLRWSRGVAAFLLPQSCFGNSRRLGRNRQLQRATGSKKRKGVPVLLPAPASELTWVALFSCPLNLSFRGLLATLRPEVSFGQTWGQDLTPRLLHSRGE